MCACNCVDQTTREILNEMGDSIMPTFMSPVGAQSLNNSNSRSMFKKKDNNQQKLLINNTMMQYRQQQSEEDIIQKMRAAKDNSIYSFRLDPAAHNNVTNNKSEYDGLIHRRSFPRNNYYDDYSDSNSSYFNKNQCC